MAGIVIEETEQKNKIRDGIDGEEYILRKRLPRKWPKRKNDVYVNQKTNFKAQLVRCWKLLDSGHDEIYIHGLGVAIDRAMNIALQLKAKGTGSIEVSVNTDTVELVDDLEPTNEDLEPETQTRNTSAIHIKVFKINIVESLKATALQG